MDSIQAQLQIRHNALEAQEYAQDLMAWQRDMQARGSSAKQQHAAQQHHPQLHVRGRASGAVAAAPTAAKQSADPQPGKEAHPAAHTYKNYSKWDKFDVDAALEATEAASGSSSKASRLPAVPAPSAVRDQQQQQPPMMEPVVPNAPAQTPASTAAALKDQGNKLFQARYYEDAISCYSQSIDAHPTAVAYANRAMALLKLDKHCEAETDCTAALQLDPSYVKAWHRRATARKQLGQLLQAASDYEEALRLEPSNGPLQADRDQTLDQALKQQQLQCNSSSSSSTWHSIPVKLQPGTPPQRQQQQQAPSAPAAAGSPKQGGEQLPGQPGPQQQQEQPPQDATFTAAAANGAVRPVTPTGTSSSRGSSAQASPQQRQAVAAAAQAAAQQLAARLASSLKAPKTGHEFESAWRSLKGDVQLQGKYLRLLTPQQLPTLFKSSLTAQLVSSLLTAALTAIAQPPAPAAAPAADDAGDAQQQQQQLSPAHAVGLVEGLAAVPRFSMMAMSLGSRDKAALRQLWDAAAVAVAADGNLQERLAAVRPQYRL